MINISDGQADILSLLLKSSNGAKLFLTHYERPSKQSDRHWGDLYGWHVATYNKNEEIYQSLLKIHAMAVNGLAHRGLIEQVPMGQKFTSRGWIAYQLDEGRRVMAQQTLDSYTARSTRLTMSKLEAMAKAFGAKVHYESARKLFYISSVNAPGKRKYVGGTKGSGHKMIKKVGDLTRKEWREELVLAITELNDIPK